MRILIALALSFLVYPALAQQFPVTIEHDNGSITLEKPAERILVISEEFIEVFVAMGVAPAGVGLWRNSFGSEPYTKLPYLDRSIPGAPMPFDGSEPNMELVLSLDPDLIFFHMSFGEPQTELIAQYEQVAPVIAILGAKPDAWKEVATDLGLATGTGDVATRVIAQFEARVAELQAIMAPIAKAHPTVTAVFGWGDSSGYFDERFSIGAHFVLLGLTITSPLGDAMPEGGFEVASAESVTQIDSDTIFVIRGGDSPFDALLARRPQPVLETPLPPGIGHSGPYAEMLYLEAIAARYQEQYGP